MLKSMAIYRISPLELLRTRGSRREELQNSSLQTPRGIQKVQLLHSGSYTLEAPEYPKQLALGPCIMGEALSFGFLDFEAIMRAQRWIWLFLGVLMERALLIGVYVRTPLGPLIVGDSHLLFGSAGGSGLGEAHSSGANAACSTSSLPAPPRPHTRPKSCTTVS